MISLIYDLILHYDKCSLDNLELIKTDAGNYYLHATYIAEDDTGIYKVDIPKVYLPIDKNSIHVRELPRANFAGLMGRRLKPDIICDLGYGEQYIGNGTDDAVIIETIEKKIHELTVSEIEKKLGYKIKIIAEKEGEMNDEKTN